VIVDDLSAKVGKQESVVHSIEN